MSNLFSVHSNSSSRELVFSDRKGEYFRVELHGDVTASIDVWAYTDASGLSNLFQELASLEKPWEGEKNWESIEGEFSISVTCSTLGEVLFQIQLRGMYGAPEEWKVNTGLAAEFGQLQGLAKGAKGVFHEPNT